MHIDYNLRKQIGHLDNGTNISFGHLDNWTNISGELGEDIVASLQYKIWGQYHTRHENPSCKNIKYKLAKS